MENNVEVLVVRVGNVVHIRVQFKGNLNARK